MEIVYLIIFFIIFTINVFYWYENHHSIYFLNKRNIQYIRYDLEKYIQNISKYEVYDKIGIQTKHKNIIQTQYIKYIEHFTYYEKNILTQYIKYIRNTYHYPFLKNNWYFVKINNNLEKGMPFTIGKYIYLPQHFIDTLIYLHKNNLDVEKKNIYDTLIHEKIHVLQRKNTQVFNTFYTKKLDYIYVKKIIIKYPWKQLHFKNPDGIDINWILFNKKQYHYYLPMLIIKKKKLKQIAIYLEKKKNYFITTTKYIPLSNLSIFKQYPKNISTYHPNEITAYILPKMILKSHTLNKNIINTFKPLLNNLKTL